MFHTALHRWHGRTPRYTARRRQHGVSLVELLVGVAIGLMVMTAAISTLVLSRVTSGVADDQLEMQQQANMAIRIMGTMLRNGFSRELVVLAGFGPIFTPDPVFPGTTMAVQALPRSAAGDDSFSVRFSDAGPAAPPLLAVASQDCLGNTNAPPVVGAAVTSTFAVDNLSRLTCTGTNAATGAQPLIGNVRRLRVLYIVSNVPVGGGAVTTQYFTQATLPAALPAGSNVTGMELCLEMASVPRGGNANVASAYTDCDGVAQAPNDNAIHVVVRQAVRIRSVMVAPV